MSDTPTIHREHVRHPGQLSGTLARSRSLARRLLRTRRQVLIAAGAGAAAVAGLGSTAVALLGDSIDDEASGRPGSPREAGAFADRDASYVKGEALDLGASGVAETPALAAEAALEATPKFATPLIRDPVLHLLRRATFGSTSPDIAQVRREGIDAWIERQLDPGQIGDDALDRVLEALGPGTTFRGIAQGASLPRSLVGASEKLVLRGIGEFRLDHTGSTAVRDKTLAALGALYTGLDQQSGTAALAAQARNTLQSLATARRIAETPYQPVMAYPPGGFAGQLRDVARLIKAQVGLRVVAMDVGGWDMHTGLGRVGAGEMRNHLDQIAKTLDAFATDLGPAFDDVTVVTMSEFGRRVAENGNAGTDHGHGGVMLLLGGGLAGGGVHGRWPGLAEAALDHGDLARANDYRDVLGELLTVRLGIGDLKKIFPGHTYQRLGVFR